MNKSKKMIAHIPARGGSKRVPGKNLRNLAGQPLLAYTVKATLSCKELSSVYVNTDSDEIALLAEKLGVPVYRRRSELAADAVTSEDFNMDIIDALRPDILVMVNPVCPLIEGTDIQAAIDVYRKEDVDTLISVSETKLQCFYEGEPVNIDVNSKLTPTQDNKPVEICNWAVTIWDAEKYRQRFQKSGYAVFGEKRKFYPISPLKAIKISTEEDFQIAELLIKAKRKK